MLRRLALSGLLLGTPVTAAEYTIGELVVEQPVAAASAKLAKAGAAYMTVTNNGDTPDRLLAVEADFPKVMIHATVESDGIARMVHLDEGVELNPGETISFVPGGLHVMFMGLTEPLESGEMLPATLVFETAGELEIMFTIMDRSEIMRNPGVKQGS